MANKKIVHFRLKNDFWSYTAYGCHTLKKALEQYGFKRSQISEWWKENE